MSSIGPNQDMEHELDSTDEELPIPQSKSKDKSNAIQWKLKRISLEEDPLCATKSMDAAKKNVTLNEHGQPVGPDDSTCNEFISFLGTIARKANILPLTVKNWPILRNEKKEELWDYVLKHFIVPIEGKKWVLQTIGAAWRRYKCYLKRVHFHKYDNDKTRMIKRPKLVPKNMFQDLLKIWNDVKYEERCMQNKANWLVGKEKNIMHTS
ncbi:uncharacterized protein LOC110730399 isoform X1 [Chenopodium quinoa]|uniref:uncharacterized protein LOC110730399 isoform X1 n=1 Tax=Chenopodium quinoa TaxID=63459 RepID=UPI000B78CC6B|nr:uncharacterized protein LOC110730399 isoform X1 [Chenopodium quinoa]XP_021765884.1 uncharacterized protein LOC110730399 isoform X1 [Chenopodium quinoa]